MVATIQQIIGKINPKLYAKNGSELLKKYGSSENIPAEEVEPQPIIHVPDSATPKYFTKVGLTAEHKLVYNSPGEALEPIYFFVIDLMNDRGLAPEKLVDNFSDAPGSVQFSETITKAIRMRDEVSKMMTSIGVVLRNVIQILYDLKDFKMRLQIYDDYKNKEKKEAALQSLKQLWLDKVDLATKGQGSIHAMTTGQLGYTTLREAFLIAKKDEDVDKLDINDRVKRILKPRIHEFNIWLEESEKELRKRYEIQRNYLKSQVNSLKLYSRWVKPYLKASQQLESKDPGRNPSLVKMFNTILLELSLLGKSKIKPEDAALSGELPKDFQKMKLKRDYYSCILVNFNFRAIPAQGRLIGRIEISFSAYALNTDEIKKIDRELEKSDVGDVLKLIEGATTESLDEIQKEIDFFLEDKEDKKAKESSNDSSNPFLALIGYYDKGAKKEPEKKSEDKDKPIKPDDWIEKTHLRPLAADKAVATAFDLFDIYKKANGMVSFT